MSNQTATQADKWAARRERFMLDPLPVRLGELAASLSSARSFSDHPDHCKGVKIFIDESAHYVEWLIPEAAPNLQAELNELRRLLTHWRDNWQAIWDDSVERASVAAQAGGWSQKMLERSGLLDYDDWRTVFRRAPAPSTSVEAA
jgi:hypothetical protein